MNIKEGIQDLYISMNMPLKLLMFFFDPNFVLQTVDEIYKVASISLSPNVPAQIFVSCTECFSVRCFDLFVQNMFLASLVLFSVSFSSSFSPVFTFVLQMGLMLNQPKPGDISYDQFARER